MARIVLTGVALFSFCAIEALSSSKHACTAATPTPSMLQLSQERIRRRNEVNGVSLTREKLIKTDAIAQSKKASSCPSMVVFVASRAKGAPLRNTLRKNQPGSAGWQDSTMLFALCQPSDLASRASLEKENSKFGDLVIMDCEEGYSQGRLTRKTVAIMEAYRDHFSDRALLFKDDGDTFVDWRKLCSTIESLELDEMRLTNSYMGHQYGAYKPRRDPKSKFYEPPEVWSHDYLSSMAGGPGYLLGGGLVRTMLLNDVPRHNMLWNEDKAVGVWVMKLDELQNSTQWVNLPSNDGYRKINDIRHTCRTCPFPYVMYYNLQRHTIECLINKVQLLEHTPPREFNGCLRQELQPTPQ